MMTKTLQTKTFGMLRSTLTAGLVAGMALAAFATGASAQDDDYLKCFKVRDEATFSAATIELDPTLGVYGLQSCTVKARAKKFCVPADANVTAIEGGSTQGVDGEALVSVRLCYKLRCPVEEIAPQEISDVFGTRDVGNFKAVEVCTPAIPGPVPPDLGDDFSGVALDPAWSVLHPTLATIQVSGGFLSLIPTATGAPDIWFNAGEGPLVYKQVTGDFDVYATMSVRDPGMPANPPPTQYRLAGILARDPASSPASSNTVHVAIGAGATAQGTSYEYKSTDDSVSTWMATPVASASGQVRLVRTGSMFEMFWRALPADPWTSIYSVNRADMPATLQVGPMIYSVESPASIEARFDEIVFQ